MKDGLKIFGLAGIISLSGFTLSGCSNLYNHEFKHPFGNAMIIEPLPAHLSIDYDINKDGIFDLRMFYTIAKISDQNELVYELLKVVKDLNGNHQFESNEVIYENPKYFPIGERIWI